jgi:putative MATE family efflux protein
MTVGSPTKLILAFSLPLLIGNFFQQAFVLVDSAVVGRMIGAEALAAVGATGKMMFLIIGFSWGATAGLAIPISNAFGAGNMAAVRRYVGASAVVAGLIAILITAIGVIFGPSLLVAINTPPELFEMAKQYQTIMFSAASLTVAYNWFSSTVRAVGDSKTPLYFLIFSSILNAGLSVLFVGSFGFQVAGVAFATIITQAIALVACVIYVRRKMAEIFPSQREFRDSLRHLWEPARIGLPMGFQASVIGIGTTLMQAAINQIGTDAVAAATVAARIEGLAMMPLGTLGVAMATFVAQNYGAKAYQRIRSGVLSMSIISMAAGVLLGAVLYIFSDQMISIFLSAPNAAVVELVHAHFRIGGIWYFALGMIFIMRNAIQGLGTATIPTISGFVELAVRAISALFFVGTFGWSAVIWGLPMGWTLGAALCTVAWFVHRKRLIGLQKDQKDEKDQQDQTAPTERMVSETELAIAA